MSTANPPSLSASPSRPCSFFVPQSDTWGVGLHGATAVDTFLVNQDTQEQWQAQVQAAKAIIDPAPLHTGRSMSMMRIFHRLEIFRSTKPVSPRQADSAETHDNHASKEAGNGQRGVHPVRDVLCLRRPLSLRAECGVGVGVDRHQILHAVHETE